MATYVVGTQKTRLNEKFLLCTQNIMTLKISIFFQDFVQGR